MKAGMKGVQVPAWWGKLTANDDAEARFAAGLSQTRWSRYHLDRVSIRAQHGYNKRGDRQRRTLQNVVLGSGEN